MNQTETPHPGMACYWYANYSCGCERPGVKWECLTCSIKDGSRIRAEPLYSVQRAASHRAAGHDVREVKP